MTANCGEGPARSGERDEQFRAAFEFLPIGVADLDFEGRILRFNPKLAELAGRAPGDLLGQRLEPLMPAGAAAPPWAADWRDAPPPPHERPLLRADGRALWVRLTLSLQPPAAGRPAHLVALVEDIDDCRRARMELQEASERHRQVADMLPVGVYACDAEGLVTFFNQRAAQLWGRPPRIGDPEFRFGGATRRYTSGGEPLPPAGTPMARAMREGRSLRDQEFVIEQPDGTRIPVLLNVDPLRDAQGTITGAIAAFVGLSEQKRAEEALADREERLRMALEAATMDAFEYEPATGRVRRHGPLGQRLGLAQEYPVADYFALIHPEDRAGFLALVEGLGPQRPGYAHEYRLCLPDGSQYWIADLARARFDAQGRLQRLSGVFSDVSERRAAEQELARRAEHQALLLEVTRSLLEAGQDEAAVARCVFDKVARHLGADFCVNYRLDPVGGVLERVAGFGLSPRLGEAASRLDAAVPSGAARIVELQHAALARHGAVGPDSGLGAYACHPLLARDGSVMGTFSLGSTTRAAFSQDEAGFIQALSRFIALDWERIRFEQELHRREEQLRVVLDAGQLGTWWRDLRSGELHLDARARAHFGFEAESVTAEAHLARVHPDDVERLRREIAVADALAPGHENRSIEHRVVLPDGSERWLAVQAKTFPEAGVRIGTSQDVTARKRIEQVLEETAADLKRAQAVASLGSWRLDVQGGTLHWSEEAYRIFGLPLDAGIDYERFLDRVHPEDRSYVDGKWRAALEGREPYDIEHRIVVGTELRWVREKAELDFDAQGRIHSGFGTVQDITGRKRAEAALRESEARFRELADAMPQMVWQSEARGGGYEYVNQQYRQRVLEGSGGDWTKVLHPDDRQRTSEAWSRAVREGQPYEIEHRVRHEDGSWHWYLSRAVPVRDAAGRVLRWYGTATDVDALKRAEAAVTEGAARIAAVVDTALDGIVTLDEGGRIESVNPALEAIFGWRAAELAGRPVALLVPDADTPQQPFPGVLRDGAQAGRELQGRRRDASLFPLEVSLSETRLAGRRVFTAFLRDITVRREQEQAMQRIAAELSEADRRKDEFLATLAHELRNPLGPLRNAAQMLRAHAQGEPALQWTGGVIERQVSHLARLIDDLLDVSRITRNKLQLRRERITLRAVIDGALEASLPQVEAHGHALTVELPPQEVTLEGDPVRLVQVFQNLLDNAAKYTPQGGRLSLSARCDGPQVEVLVHDNGIGLPPESLPRLFDMFYQVDRTLERTRGGLGIGLTLVRRLVQMHGGTIEAQSPGRGLGSTFVVRLPAAAAAAPAAAPPADAAASPVRHRVLVADDNVDSAESMALLLQIAGHEVHVAHDGLQAVQKAEQLRPTLILLDIGMPGLNGYEAARRIRASDWSRGVLLVAQTGWGQQEDIRRSHEAGFDAHLTKPVDLDMLMALLARQPVSIG